MTETRGYLRDAKMRKGKCVMVHCLKAAIKRGKKCMKYCPKCQRQLLKERHPLTYWFDILRSNAKRRGISFELTIEEFKIFDDKYNYIALKGRGAGKATIDRKKSNIGYTLDNIQVLEHSSNSRKVHIDKKLKHMYENEQTPTEDEINEFKTCLESFGNDIELYKPDINKNYDF